MAWNSLPTLDAATVSGLPPAQYTTYWNLVNSLSNMERPTDSPGEYAALQNLIQSVQGQAQLQKQINAIQTEQARQQAADPLGQSGGSAGIGPRYQPTYANHGASDPLNVMNYGTNNYRVNDLYQQLFGRNADLEGALYWQNQIGEQLRPDTLRAMLEAGKNLNVPVIDPYAQIANRTDGRATKNYSVEQLSWTPEDVSAYLQSQQLYGDAPGITQGIAAYNQQNPSKPTLDQDTIAAIYGMSPGQGQQWMDQYRQDQNTIRDLYTTALGRLDPDDSGIRYWTEQLRGGTPVGDVRANMQYAAQNLGYKLPGQPGFQPYTVGPAQAPTIQSPAIQTPATQSAGIASLV